MNKLRWMSIMAALGVAGALQAQTQTPPDPTQTDPRPSTSQTEGTAADRTAPGETPTRGTAQGTTDTNPAPATSETEGTAADRTPPGATRSGTDSTRMAAASSGGMRASKIIGSNVQSTSGETIGEVKDVIMDRDGRITHAVISHGGTMGAGARLTAVPWPVLNRMMKGDRMVVERSTLEKAPSFENDKWPNLTSNTWSSDADSYWTAQGGRPR